LPITLIGHRSDPIVSYIKGCHFINTQFGIDSFHDWEAHHYFLCICDGQDKFLFGALQAFLGWKLMLYDVCFTNPGSKVGAWDRTIHRSTLRSNSQLCIVQLGYSDTRSYLILILLLLILAPPISECQLADHSHWS